MSEHRWGLALVWNEILEEKKDRKYEKRDHLWASELGKSPIDILLKMRGEEPTNPPNARSRRKFVAGDIWEWLVGIILKRAGILQSQQDWIKFQYDGLLAVTGRLDYLAGGMPNYEEAEKGLVEMGLPEIFIKAGKKIVRHLKEKYPNGLKSRILEIKSTSSFMFDKMEKTGLPLVNHRKQLFHYLKAKNMEMGALVYICKDDCRMTELIVMNPSFVEDEYKKDIELLTKYHREGNLPPLEKFIVFDEEEGKFAKNWKIEYSAYLTKLYGFEKPRDYTDKYKPIVESWNRVLGRVKENKEMTKNNEEKMVQMKEYGFDIEKIKGGLKK